VTRRQWEDEMKRIPGRTKAGKVILLGLAALTAAGCTAAAPTPIYVLVTPAPTLTPIVIYLTPGPAATATAPIAQATAAPTPPPTAAPTPVPTAAATSRAAMCSGTDANRAFFESAAVDLSFDVYCAVVPSSWWIQAGKYENGRLEVQYKNGSGAMLVAAEGNVCAIPCAVMAPIVGSASFGDRSGQVYQTSLGFLLIVGPNGHQTYDLLGTGLTQAQFSAFAAALRKVPRS
jgi:hypothetical protein